MRAAAGVDTLLEASIGRAKRDDPRLANYRALELEVDGRTRSLEVADSDEVLIDDKACGYRLSDYQRWGGLRREYLPDGSEIHAETSRMYLRALATAGAKRVRVERAGALTSARRIYEKPHAQLCDCRLSPRGKLATRVCRRCPSEWRAAR